MTSPAKTKHPPTETAPETTANPNGSPSLALSTVPPLPGLNGDGAPAALPGRSPRGRSSRLLIVGALLALGAGVAGAGWAIFGNPFASPPEGLLLHEVKRGPLSLTIKQRGTLESSHNRDIVVRVKTGSRSAGGNVFIKWVIPDGSRVRAGDKLVELDSSALQEEQRSQQILVDQAYAAQVQAEEQLKIVKSQGESDIATAEVAITLAALDLEKYCGLPRGSLDKLSLKEVEGLDLVGAALPDKGEYRQLLDDVSGRMEQARAELQLWQEKADWSERMVKMGFFSPSAAQADQTTLLSKREAFNKVVREKEVLEQFDRRKMITDYQSKLAEAIRALDRVKAQARAEEAKALADLKTKESVYRQEKAKLDEIEQQIDFCTIYAPQDGMVVYYVSERSRWGNSDEGMIAEGVPVKEGQKLMQLPDMSKMQVTLKIHESVVMNLKADVYEDTGFSDAILDVQNALFFAPLAPLGRRMYERPLLAHLEQQFQEYDQIKVADGQKATIKVDALGGQTLKGHVKSVATVATQEWFQPDVKMFPTVVTIENEVPGLRPNMSAEVTIHVADTLKDVVTLPIPAVVGGPEMGNVRKCYVVTPDGPREREIEIGMSSETLVEVRKGLKEGEVVVLNPKVIVGEGAVTHEIGGGLEPKGPRGKGGKGGKGGPKGAGGGKNDGGKNDGSGGAGEGRDRPPAGK